MISCQLSTSHRFGRIRNQAFTVTELVVVIGIIGLLIGITIPAVMKVRMTADRMACSSKMRQLGMACHNFASDSSSQSFPTGCAYPSLKHDWDTGWQNAVSWHTTILPFLEQEALWRKAFLAYRADPRGNSALHEEISVVALGIFICPSDSRRYGTDFAPYVYGLTSYLGVMGTSSTEQDGVLMVRDSVRVTDITDGTSNTLMIGERPPGPRGEKGGWYSQWGSAVCATSQLCPAGYSLWQIGSGVGCPVEGPALQPGRLDDACSVRHFWSLHGAGANFVFADGSVRFITNQQAGILPLLATRAGGEVASLP